MTLTHEAIVIIGIWTALLSAAALLGVATVLLAKAWYAVIGALVESQMPGVTAVWNSFAFSKVWKGVMDKTRDAYLAGEFKEEDAKNVRAALDRFYGPGWPKAASR